jgi:DNA-binding response OmpR family regulator
MNPEIRPSMPLTLVLSVGLDVSLLETRNMMLQSAGYTVESALSVRAAAHRFLAGDFDLVMLCHSILAKERDRITCLIRATGSRTPVVFISGVAGQCDAFATATLEDGPDKFVLGVSEVLLRAARAWSGVRRDRQDLSDVRGKKSPSSSGDFERQQQSKVATVASFSRAPSRGLRVEPLVGLLCR